MASETSTPDSVDTVIVGNGPSALILSYILHGNVPYYIGGHYDPLLNEKLSKSANLLDLRPEVYRHLHTSIQYSTQALPVAVLLDTLLRPRGDVDLHAKGCVQWRREPAKAVPHIVLGNASEAGGQWADNPVEASIEIGSLSYAEQLSLPGYSFAEHWLKVKGCAMPDLTRPSRRDIAAYYAAYPAAVGIADGIRVQAHVGRIYRDGDGFHVLPQKIRCNHLVLASGTHSFNMPPPKFLEPLNRLSDDDSHVLVIGSGYTAADIMISTPPDRHIIHLFNWDPEHRPSPLKACHHQAYPEYAWVYRQMKAVAARFDGETLPEPLSGLKKAVMRSEFESFSQRNWVTTYEGFPNARVMAIADNSEQNDHVPLHSSSLAPSPSRSPQRKVNHEAFIRIGRSSSGTSITRKITSLRYATGRRGSLSYLAPSLLAEVHPLEKASSDLHRPADLPKNLLHPAHAQLPEHAPQHSIHGKRLSLIGEDSIEESRRSSVEYDFGVDAAPHGIVSGQTLRSRIEQGLDEAEDETAGVQLDNAMGLELASHVFVVGSLTGDSLVRFAVGGCVVVAGKIMRDREGKSLATAIAEQPRVDSSAIVQIQADSSLGSAANKPVEEAPNGYVQPPKPVLQEAPVVAETDDTRSPPPDASRVAFRKAEDEKHKKFGRHKSKSMKEDKSGKCIVC